MTATTDDLEELAGLIHFRVGAWQDFGYEKPPAPDSATIPPLGKRSASAIKAGHEAVKDIDRLIARLHQVRSQLVSELRQDEDIRAARVDAMLAGEQIPECPECGQGAPHIAQTNDEGRHWQCTRCGHEWATP